jgi:putative phosphoribosyl transferase
VQIPAAGVRLDGDLEGPAEAPGIVIFAHGSGSSRHSPRNRQVASRLQRAGLRTILFDLLTAEEERDEVAGAHRRFDIPLLSERLVAVTDWCVDRGPGQATGYFGASTGAAAALVAAAARPGAVHAVVSRGGRPDLAADALPAVTAPTLLIVGELDSEVIELNRLAAAQMRCVTHTEIVAGATHLFEEQGTLERVADLAAEWFVRYLPASDPVSG